MKQNQVKVMGFFVFFRGKSLTPSSCLDGRREREQDFNAIKTNGGVVSPTQTRDDGKVDLCFKEIDDQGHDQLMAVEKRNTCAEESRFALSRPKCKCTRGRKTRAKDFVVT